MNTPINTALPSANAQQYFNQESELTMNELIKVSNRSIGEAQVQTVNARELHAFLENGDHFATWIKDRIAQYDFQENQDFVSFSENAEKPQGGRPAKEYALSIDMAKELAMVERNEKGKQARQYFIDCERQAKEIVHRDPIQVLNDPAAMRGLLLNYMYNEDILKAELRRTA